MKPIEIKSIVNIDISKESLQEIENKRIDAQNKLHDENLTFKEYYNLCIRARMSSKEILEGLKCFIINKINNRKYKVYETLKDTFEIYEEENLICRLYKIKDQYYISPNSIQIHGLYEERG